MKLEEFLEEWLEVAVKPSHHRKTWSIHEVHIGVHIVVELGELELDQLTPNQVQRLMARKLAEGLKPGERSGRFVAR